MNEIYLGDGVYASFDGFQYKLRTPRATGDEEIYLDRHTLAAFDEFRLEVERRYRKEVER